MPGTPASRAAMVVRVFFETAYVALSPRERRSSFSAFTLSPRYSVSTIPDDEVNFLLSSATAAALSGLAIVPPSLLTTRSGGGGPKVDR